MKEKMTAEKIEEWMRDCTLCPRRCHADRRAGGTGFCGQGTKIRAARAALHFWEEPCISGSQGSGTVFFSGCSLQCVFCQNYEIAHDRNADGKGINSNVANSNNTHENDINGHIAHQKSGQPISVQRLSQIFLELEKKGAANINLVTGAHFLPQICLALEAAKERGLSLPIVYNSSGYEEVASLGMLEGLVDIYLPDLKYHSPQLSGQYSHAPDYFEKASAAIGEMVRQTGTPVLDPVTGLMKKGVIVRHLLLPGHVGDSKRILRYLHDTYGNDIYVSIMNQYTPMEQITGSAEWSGTDLSRTVTAQEYERVLDFADKIGIEQGYRQEGGTAAESFIPAFDGEGL